MTQNIRVLCHIDTVQSTNGAGLVGVGVSGVSPDGSVNITETLGAPMSVYVDVNSYTLRDDIAASVKTHLEAAPFNLTFAADDILRFID